MGPAEEGVESRSLFVWSLLLASRQCIREYVESQIASKQTPPVDRHQVPASDMQ